MTRTPIKLSIRDVDGTFVTNDKVLTSRGAKPWNGRDFASIQFTITGSRPPRGMAMLTKALKLKVPIAVFNGGMFVESDLSTMIEQLLPIAVGVATEFHAAAWKRMVDDFLRQWSAQSGNAFVPFDAVHDYHFYLDGKLRIAGSGSFLTSSRIQPPEEKIRSWREPETRSCFNY